ncbi:MAG: hypothetical protein AB1726_04455 [Planctomycetota bacterium]
MQRPMMAAFLVLAAGAQRAWAEVEWSQFRGSGGQGVAADESPLPVELDPERNLAWRCAVPSGISSPCLWGERIFVTGSTGDDLETVAVDRSRGTVLWRRRCERPGRSGSTR